MALTRSRWLLPVMSLITAGAMFAGPIAALADDDHGHDRDRGRGDDDDRGRVTIVVPAGAQPVVVQRREEEEDENEAPVVAVPAATLLVNAINNEVANLMNRDVEMEDADEVEEVEVGQIVNISLATLETGLSAADATAVTNAVNANSAALQTFLNSGTLQANGIKAALMADNITPANVLAILRGRDDRLIVVTP